MNVMDLGPMVTRARAEAKAFRLVDFAMTMEALAERGLRGALAQWKKDTEFVPTDENGMLIDINTEQDYQREQREWIEIANREAAASAG